MRISINNFFKKKKGLFIIIIIFIILFIINKSAKLFLNESKLERRTQPEFIEKVYGKERAEDYKIVLAEQLSPLQYEPFIEFKENPRINKFTAVSEFGNRCNDDNVLLCKIPTGGQTEIWIFGGSTVFGYGVKNSETISSHLENLLNKKFNVINFGTGFYNSTQERILFNNLITKLPPPKAVIFLNGLNEFVNNFENNESQISSFIKYKINKSSKDDLLEYFKERILRLNMVRLYSEYSQNNSIKNEKKKIKNFDQIINIYINNQKLTKSIASSYEVKHLHVLQPVPIYLDSYKSSNVPKKFQRNMEKDLNIKNVKIGYEKYLERKLDFILDLSKFSIDEPMYIDGVHYSSEFNMEIAKLLKTKLNL